MKKTPVIAESGARRIATLTRVGETPSIKCGVAMVAVNSKQRHDYIYANTIDAPFLPARAPNSPGHLEAELRIEPAPGVLIWLRARMFDRSPLMLRVNSAIFGFVYIGRGRINSLYEHPGAMVEVHLGLTHAGVTRGDG